MYKLATARWSGIEIPGLLHHFSFVRIFRDTTDIVATNCFIFQKVKNSFTMSRDTRTRAEFVAVRNPITLERRQVQPFTLLLGLFHLLADRSIYAVITQTSAAAAFSDESYLQFCHRHQLCTILMSNKIWAWSICSHNHCKSEPSLRV